MPNLVAKPHLIAKSVAALALLPRTVAEQFGKKELDVYDGPGRVRYTAELFFWIILLVLAIFGLCQLIVYWERFRESIDQRRFISRGIQTDPAEVPRSLAQRIPIPTVAFFTKKGERLHLYGQCAGSRGTAVHTCQVCDHCRVRWQKLGADGGRLSIGHCPAEE